MIVENKSYIKVRNIWKAGKGVMNEFEEMSLTDKAIQRIREYLENEGWTAEKILDFISYITKQ